MSETWLAIIKGKHAGRCGVLMDWNGTDVYLNMDGPIFKFPRFKVAQARPAEIEAEKAFRARRRAAGWDPTPRPKRRAA